MSQSDNTNKSSGTQLMFLHRYSAPLGSVSLVSKIFVMLELEIIINLGKIKIKFCCHFAKKTQFVFSHFGTEEGVIFFSLSRKMERLQHK